MSSERILWVNKSISNIMSEEEDDIDYLDLPVGKEIFECLLLKNGNELQALLGEYTLREFIEERAELYINTLHQYHTSDDFQNGKLSVSGVEELARAEAFEGLS